MRIPRVMIAAASSGSGKTLITCGLLQALKNREKRVTAFKCGPDYIDPMFHKTVLELPSRNLDTFFTDDRTTNYLFQNGAKNSDISVIEGVMGYYDGVGGTSDQASSYEVSKVLDAPVILIINAKGMSLSAAAMIKGFLTFREDSNIRGVILNQVSQMFYPELKRAIEAETSIPVLGYVPRVSELVLESRHLGLVMPKEISQIREKLEGLSHILEETLDIDKIFGIAEQAPELEKVEYPGTKLEHTPRIAVARDEAFCFYYEDNLELMQKMGAELVFFSPIHDKKLPESIQGLMLGGGYPELYAAQLSKNHEMLTSIKTYMDKAKPVLAECGGFMYLHNTMEDNEKNAYPMVGAIEGQAYKTDKLGRFGYIELSTNKKDALLPLEKQIKGHEFHYFDSTSCGEDYQAKKPLRNREWSCIHGSINQCMGFPHIYYYSNPEFIYRFLSNCK
ncbi:cobyrinate a,c-diamide synthase [Konateibacter massiliensis]|uniref:cobyrinate a,c-diamide synthase n=1 Tax=Konateibacter massiliensis TaxID=2002841 RepID=UPI000C1574FA|nr:cobyrinate a,c-diamide synthase [Konateibacter massiliensis]